MNSIDRQLYKILIKDLYREIDGRLEWLDEVLKKARIIPFDIIAGVIFLGCLGLSLKSGLELPTQTSVSFILLLGIGCFMSVLSLFAYKGANSKLRAATTLIGSVLLMLHVQSLR